MLADIFMLSGMKINLVDAHGHFQRQSFDPEFTRNDFYLRQT